MFFDINKDLCSTYTGLDPLRLLDYPAEDVFELIKGLMDYNKRSENTNTGKGNSDVIRRKAGNNWF